MHFSLDPKDAANGAIRDLALAHTDAQGRVTFSATFFALRPRDAARGNGTLLLDVSNRGGKGALARFCLARSDDDPRVAEHFGDAWLLEQGYTIAWVGWQWDVPDAKPLRLDPARLRDEDAPGLVRSEFIPDADTPQMPLGDRDHHPIPLAAAVRLGVRSNPEEPAREIAAEKWRVVDGGRALQLEGGFKAGLLYEFVYRGKAPVVSGLSLAAVRDFVSFAKYDDRADAVLGRAARAVGFGISQSGRFLRHFVYEGFNADERARKVFDGVWADVAGAGRGSFNHRYAQASRDGNPWTNVFYPTDVFPFHDRETTSPLERRSGALLAAADKAGVVPKIFYTNSSYEYWGRAAALIHTSPDGRADLAPAPLTRVYHIAGAQHVPGVIPSVPRDSQHLALPTDHRLVQRALLDALDRWVRDDQAPPPSVYPRIADATLVTPDAVALPKREGWRTPPFPRRARLLDFGPDFERTGVVSAVQATSRGTYPLLVPAVDADGIDRGGIRLPQVAVPLGTYLGWNFRAPSAPDHMANFVGSFFPFARNEAERRASGDPRPSIVERYGDREAYLRRAAAAADDMVAARHLLAIDRDRAIEQCAKLWDSLLR